MTVETYRDKLNDLQLEVEELRAKLKEVQTGDLISRQAVNNMLEHIPIRGMKEEYGNLHFLVSLAQVSCAIEQLPSAQPESLTDKEQRIFLAAMGREEKVCKQVDAECRDCREPYEDSLVSTCREITRKVKGALWT